MSRAAAGITVAGVLLAAVGCVSGQPSFRWEVYEDGVARLGDSGEGSDPAEEARLLSAELERADAAGSAVPPGIRAHLGWLLLRSGNASGARRMFLAERTAYPESAVLMDRLLARTGP